MLRPPSTLRIPLTVVGRPKNGEVMVPQMIAVDQIRPSHQQVRTRFDAEPLGELSESIRLHGVLQPLLVRRLQSRIAIIR